jgi:hypothetical protein
MDPLENVEEYLIQEVGALISQFPEEGNLEFISLQLDCLESVNEVDVTSHSEAENCNFKGGDLECNSIRI